jgi:transcriptional regulator with XRE-family HTH domain
VLYFHVLHKVKPFVLQVVNMDRLPEKLKELRKKKSWTQEDMAREIHVSLSTVQRWEKKGGEPTRLARRELQRIFRREGIPLNQG